ncbi:hypothetical protein FB451DRAFT_1191493 [Mycena latifolia]|nr:hypothetical protein FB451DRAFT_1191493 [Mycena latifolia]
MVPTSTTTLSLTALEIWHPNIEFLAPFLNFLGRDAGFLPQLQNLSFLGCRVANHEASVVYIVKMAAAPVTARRNLSGCAELRVVHLISAEGSDVCSESMFPMEDLLLFKNLKASGMDIYIGSELKSVV